MAVLIILIIAITLIGIFINLQKIKNKILEEERDDDNKDKSIKQ